MIKKNAEYQQTLRQKRKEEGLKRLELWVFDEDRDDIIEFANFKTEIRRQKKLKKK
jgi:hypothetical protein